MKKIFSVFILGMLLSAAVFADETPRFHTLQLSPKGENSHISPFFTPENQAAETMNVRVNEQYMALAKRPVMVVYSTCESKAVNGLFRYYKSDDNKYLISASSTFLWVGNDADGTCQKIGQSFTDGDRWTFATYQDILIATNGVEQPVKYDGHTNVTANTDAHRTASDVVAELGAPFAELNTGSNLDASSWYQYKVAFYDGTTYSYSTARSNPINTGSSVRDIRLTDIPLGPTGTTIRYIYRTEGQASRAAVLAQTAYFQVDDIADNTTTAFNDAIADATIATDPAPTWATVSAGTNLTPPKGAYAYIHRERLWLSRTPTDKSTTYYSHAFKPQVFDPNDYFEVRPDDGDEITATTEFLGLFTIFKTNTIQKIYTDQVSDTNWSLSTPFSYIGTPAPFSVANTPEGIFYYGREGLYTFTGQSSRLISDAVTKEIRDVLESNVSNATGFYYKNEYHFSYTSETLGGTTNNRVLVYDTVRDAYVVDSKNINSFAALNSGTDFGVLYLGDSTTAGKVYINETTTDLLAKRLKSEFDAGTYDDARSSGDDNEGHPHLPTGSETDFIVEMAWDYTIDTWSSAGATIDGLRGTYTAAIIDRPDTTGTWTSPIYRIDAAVLTKLAWNEQLGAAGDITWATKPCNDSACSGEAFAQAYTNPAGSDLTGETAQDWIQLKASFSTTDITESPYLYVRNGYVFRLFYNKSGSTKESSVLSLWDSGWKDMGASGYEKHLWRVDVYYTGTSGTVNVEYRNIEGDVTKDFDIDMTTNPESSDTDDYIGTEEGVIYRHWTGMNTTSDPSAIGQDWRFVVTENSTDSDFKISKIVIWFYLQELSR